MYSIIRVHKDGGAHTIAHGDTKEVVEKLAQRTLLRATGYANDTFIMLNHDNPFGAVVEHGVAVPPGDPMPQFKWCSS